MKHDPLPAWLHFWLSVAKLVTKLRSEHVINQHYGTYTGGGGGGGGGVSLTNKSNKITFLEVVGENGHNLINIKVSALKLLAFDRAPNFV